MTAPVLAGPGASTGVGTRTGAGANATCAPECDEGFDLTEASGCDPFTGGFRAGRCLCACDDAWRAKGFYM